MRLAYFTPLNPVQSGISDYSEELLLALAGSTVGGRPVDIDLFIDRGYKPSNAEITRRFDMLPGRGFGRVAIRYDATVYQMGNSPAHAYIYDTLMRYPGVVVMHEFILHHLRVWMTLNGGRRKEYLATMERRYNAEGRDAARRVMLGQFPDALFNYPLSEEVIERATGVIVHSHYMERLVRDVRPNVPLAVVPMGVPLPPLIPKAEARARLGIDPDLFLVTSVGHLNPYKRVSTTLRAFKGLLLEVPNSLYLLIGSRSPNYDPTRQIDMLGLSDRVKSTGYVSQADFYYYLAASDVCLNLRHPTAGETSASLLRIMGAGVPVLVSRTGSFEELPDDAAAKVDLGDMEEDLLLDYLLLLARRPDVREAMSRAARAYVAEHHTLEGAALGYLRFLGSGVGRTDNYELRITNYELPGAEYKPAGVGAEIEVGGGGAEISGRHAIRQAEGGAQSAIRNPQSAIPRPLRVALEPVVQAALELGIEEKDEAVLLPIARDLQGLVPSAEGDGERDGSGGR